MELSAATVDRIIARLIKDGHITDNAAEYGEPGYRLDHPDGTTPMILFGNWWCRCGGELHDIQSHHPRVWEQLNRQGVDIDWSDQWAVDYDTGKAYRTEPDSYQWQPTAIYDDDGELLTPDSDITEWVAWATDEDPAKRCLFAYHVDMLEAAGWELYEDDFAAGWYGRSDDPADILARARAEHPDDEFVFVATSTGQFETRFALYHREPDA